VKISAYIPCYNNVATITKAVESVQSQSHPVDELIVVDDGSRDGSASIVEKAGVRVIRHEKNQGRGAVRARAMSEARNGLVLCCDATNILDPNFVADSLNWFEDSSIAAVVGKISQPKPQNVVERWRGRHLFNLGKTDEVRHFAPLSTFGAIVRRSAVMSVGNYLPSLRHSEDGDLGEKLLSAGFDIIHDPKLIVTSIAKNTLLQVLERHWRWKVGVDEHSAWDGYFRQIIYSVKVMAKEDLQAGDPMSSLISLLSPHYGFLKSKLSRPQNRYKLSLSGKPDFNP